MNPAQNCKYQIVTPPAAIVDDDSFATTSIDTLGYDYLQVICTVGALDIAMTALKLQTSDTDSNYADLPGATFGSSPNIDGGTSALPSGTDDNKLFVFEVDLRGKKRFFDLVATMGDGSTGGYFAAVAILSRGERTPISAAARGAAGILRV